MVSSVCLVCRAKTVLGNGYRLVEIDNIYDDKIVTNTFKVKYWNKSSKCRFMSFKEGTLLIINGSLSNDEEGNTIIVAEKVSFLDDGERSLKSL